MANIQGEIVIKRPPDVVFDCVADERNAPRYNPRMLSVEKLSEGEIGLGTRFRAETGRASRTTEMVIEFTAYERPCRLASSTRMTSVDIRGSLTFDPVPEGTLMRWQWEVRPHGALRLLTPLIVFLGRRQEQAVWAGLKRLLEEQESSTEP